MARNKLVIKRICVIAIFASILFIQEELLSFIPNVSFTPLLIAIFFFTFGAKDTFIIVTIHVLLDNIVMGSINIVYTPAMFIGWYTLVFLLFLIRNVTNKWIISLVVGLHGFIYCGCFLIASVLFYKIPFDIYLASDIPFTLILVLSSFVTTLLLFNPLVKVLKKLIIEK